MASTNTTTAALLTVKELHTSIEDAVSIERENDELVCLTVQHYGDVHQFTVVIFDVEQNPRNQVELSLAEAKQLLYLLNSAKVIALLDAAE